MALRGSLCVSWPFVINKDILKTYSLKTWFFFTFLMSTFKFCHLPIILYLSIVLRIKFILLWSWTYLYFKHIPNILLCTSCFFLILKSYICSLQSSMFWGKWDYIFVLCVVTLAHVCWWFSSSACQVLVIFS